MAEPPVSVGDEFGWTRSITPAEVSAFGALVGDQAQHHQAQGAEPVVVHGLLLMGMVSQLAAQFHFIGREFTSVFHAPAFCGRELTARMVVAEVRPLGSLGWSTRLVCEVEDERGQVLLSGSGVGVIPLDRPSAASGRPVEGKGRVMAGGEGERFTEGLRMLHRLGDQETVDGFLSLFTAHAPDLGDYIVEFVCGDLLRRPWLSLRELEMVTLTALAAQGGAEGVLALHVKAALRLGISTQEIVAVFIHVSAYAGFPRAVAAVVVANAVFADNPDLVAAADAPVRDEPPVDGSGGM